MEDPGSYPGAALARRRAPLPVPVLFVNTDLRVGGQERNLLRLIRGLDRSRVRPVVACLKEPGELAPEVEEAGIPLYSRLIHHRLDAVVLLRLARILRREGIRVVCTEGSGDKMFWGRLAGWLCRVDGLVSVLHKTRSADGRPVVERANRWLTPITDVYLAVARAQAEYLVTEEGLPRAKIQVLYNGVDLEAFGGGEREAARAALGLAPERPVVLHVAAFRPEKRHDLLLAAAAQVCRELPEALFLLAGDGPTRPEVAARVRSLGLEEVVRLLGPRQDIARLQTAADVAVLCSDAVVETFPLSVLEAMASRRPVVATDVGGLREQVVPGETGWLVPEGDAGALAAALLRLLRDPELARRMGAAGRRLVAERFSLERMIQEREALFLRLAGWDEPA